MDLSSDMYQERDFKDWDGDGISKYLGILVLIVLESLPQICLCLVPLFEVLYD